ncbi:LOW QUALITY PROTEIN: hypothetical protein ACHAWF_017295 [Thalassiosira exigua]
MRDARTALMGVGTGVGKSRATDAAVAAISSPLLDFSISEAKRVVFNVEGGSDLGLSKINAARRSHTRTCTRTQTSSWDRSSIPTWGKSITVLTCDLREVGRDDDEPVLTAASSGGTAVAEVARNGAGEYRALNFYKKRREMTRGPLGPDATVEETHTAITRGFKRPEPEPEPEPEKKSFRKRKGGFFRKWFQGSKVPVLRGGGEMGLRVVD